GSALELMTACSRTLLAVAGEASPTVSTVAAVRASGSRDITITLSFEVPEVRDPPDRLHALAGPAEAQVHLVVGGGCVGGTVGVHGLVVDDPDVHRLAVSLPVAVDLRRQQSDAEVLAPVEEHDLVLLLGVRGPAHEGHGVTEVGARVVVGVSVILPALARQRRRRHAGEVVLVGRGVMFHAACLDWFL